MYTEKTFDYALNSAIGVKSIYLINVALSKGNTQSSVMLHLE